MGSYHLSIAKDFIADGIRSFPHSRLEIHKVLLVKFFQYQSPARIAKQPLKTTNDAVEHSGAIARTPLAVSGRR